MKEVFAFLTLVAAGTGIKYDGLRVKFGWSDALADVNYFYIMPRTIHEAEGEGWRRTERPKGPMQELRMYCPPGRMVCTLYDTAGFVAGLQVAVPVDSIDPELKPEKYFVKWSAPAAEGEPPADMWTAVQYYVTEDSLKAGAGPTAENGATLQDGGVWVKGLDGKLLKIPTIESELKLTLFKKQNCVPNMGIHYYYNVSKQLDCERIFLPWFAMVTGGDLIGVGFQTMGKKPDFIKHRDWYETLPVSRRTPLLAMPHAPECMLDLQEKHGLISLHIYFVKKPWELRCKTGDSIAPAPVLDRLALSGYRYANRIGDEFKKLVYG